MPGIRPSNAVCDMHPPRLLHILEATTAGVRRYVTQLVRSGRDGWEVHVACPAIRQTHYGDVAFVDEVRRMGVTVHELPLRRAIGLHDAAAACALLDLLRRERFDLIHTHSSKAGFLGRLAARLIGVPVIHTPNGLYFLEQRGFKRRFYLMLERLAGRWTAHMIAVSEGEREVIVHERLVIPERVRLIENGVDAAQVHRLANEVPATVMRHALGLDDGGPLICAVGRMVPQKDPLTLVRAARRVLQIIPEARFVWCGDGELHRATQQLAHELGVPLTVSGHLEEIWSAMRLFDVFVLPSLYEGLPFTLLEAMALGVPVVATDVVGTCDVMRGEPIGWLAEPRDDAALAQAIVQALTDSEEARRRVEAARCLVETRYSLRRMLEAHGTLYRQVLSARGGRAA